jgi:hypothetical protein
MRVKVFPCFFVTVFNTVSSSPQIALSQRMLGAVLREMGDSLSKNLLYVRGKEGRAK